MAEFAPVLPLGVASAFKERNVLGKYHLLLAHDVAANADEYRRVYGDIMYGTIIMDNSVIELGYPVDHDTLLRAVEAVKANVVVLPDVLLDMDGTIEATLRGLEAWKDIIGDGVSGMAVPQGETFDEWVQCLEIFAEIDEIGWIGIPRNVREKLKTSRIKAADIFNVICPHKKAHLLGFSDDLQDDIIATKSCIGVEGIDSAVPIRLGMRDHQTISLGRRDHSPRGDWWDDPGEHLELGISNTELVRSWLKKPEVRK